MLRRRLACIHRLAYRWYLKPSEGLRLHRKPKTEAERHGLIMVGVSKKHIKKKLSGVCRINLGGFPEQLPRAVDKGIQHCKWS